MVQLLSLSECDMSKHSQHSMYTPSHVESTVSSPPCICETMLQQPLESCIVRSQISTSSKSSIKGPCMWSRLVNKRTELAAAVEGGEMEGPPPLEEVAVEVVVCDSTWFTFLESGFP